MENKDFNVGDLVRLKRAFGSRFSHPYSTPEQLGLGIIIEKLSELFILHHNGIDLEEHFDKQYQVVKTGKIRIFSDSIKTRICKVYWFKLEKLKWEYEDDLSLVEDGTSNN